MPRVCVFCGSRRGANPVYTTVASELGHALASRGFGLVYGGGAVGLMGVVADAALAAGGDVVGVIPGALLEREIGHAGLADLRVTGSMHERKATMAELADAFLALPGGMGTLEELCETLTWAQLGLYAKPVVILDVEGFYEPFFALLDRARDAGFLAPAHRRLARRAATVEEALALVAEPPAERPRTWIGPEES